MNMDQDILLQMTDITKTFPGVKALDHVSLTLKRGTVHALMGENGAGKSTLMKCLFGIYNKDSGTILLEGKEVNFKNSREALDNGVAMVHQELNQALKRSVMDNIWLGRYPKHLGLVVDETKMYRETMKIFDELGINVDPHRIMSTMPVSQRQMVEIAKAVSYRSKVIVFDEPTSSLTEDEVEHLFRIINMLRDRGVGIIYISHKMAEIKRISDEITIMRDGQWIATRPAAELEVNDIIRLMVGRELNNQFPPKTNKPGEPFLKVEHLTGQYNGLRDVNFTARRGEILGIAGIAGSGQKELLESISGLQKLEAGSKITYIEPDGTECLLNGMDPLDIIRKGLLLSFVPEDRFGMGLVGGMNIIQNIMLRTYRRGKGPLTDRKFPRDLSQKIVDDLEVVTPDINRTPIRRLSGGNVQKVLVGREIAQNPAVLMTAYAVRGLDINTSYVIYNLLTEQKMKGVSVIYVGEDLDVLLELCDRILVLCGGKISGIVDARTATKEEIGLLMTKV